MQITFSKLVDGFRLYNEAANRSRQTIRWYNYHLRGFLAWLEINSYSTALDQITPTIIREHISALQRSDTRYANHPTHPTQQRAMSPSNVRGRVTSLSALFNWAEREELLTNNPMRKVPKPKVPKTILPGFSHSEIQSLIKACGELPEATAIREKALLLFLLDTGVRISEALNLKMTNLHLEEGRALVMGKGAKERYVFIGKSTKRALWRYISLSRPEPAPNVDRVFLTFQGRPLPYRRATFELQRLAKKSGIENVHPHRFRRTAAIQFLRNNGSLFALQKMLGHETLDMVRRYVELASDDVEQAHKTASPVDNWNL